jgi:CDP-diacylglycerol--glycerol-3-phosphate 3-phosphatidyltransferase
MTTANKVTILRILLVPFFVVELIYFILSGNEVHRLLAILSFTIAAILDGVDGYIARHYHQTSELGKILDPLADKLLLVSAIVTLSLNHGNFLGQIPIWFTGTILGRDFLVLLGIGVIRFIVGNVKVRPRISGKIATVLQMAVVILVLMKWDVQFGAKNFFYCTLAAAICTGISGLLYVFDGIKQLGSHPASSAAQNDPR